MTTSGYPLPMASGVATIAQYTPFQIWAGEKAVTTSQALAGATPILQFQPVGMDVNSFLVPWNPAAQAAVGEAYASDVLTFTANPAAADTITINGVALTYVAAITGANQVLLGSTQAVTMANLIAVVNAAPSTFLVNGVITGANTIDFIATAPGTAANAVTMTENSTATSFATATLAGGTTAVKRGPESKLIGVAAQPIAANTYGPYWDGGVFNHEILVWPSGITTLQQRKAAFAGTPMSCAQLLGGPVIPGQ